MAHSRSVHLSIHDYEDKRHYMSIRLRNRTEELMNEHFENPGN